MALDEWEAVTRAAMKRLLTHAGKVELSNTEEFTFRAFFMDAAWDLLDHPTFQTEWNKFDLLVQVGGAATLIEFKYYLWRRVSDLKGRPGRPKGGASLQNETEFWATFNRLQSAPADGIAQRRLVLVYEDDSDRPGRGYHASYGHLRPSERIAQVWRVPADSAVQGRRLVGRVFEPISPSSASSGLS